MAFRRMTERGYRRIGYVASHRFDRNTGGNFRAGYLSAQNDLVPLRRQLPPLNLTEESIAADVRDLRRWLRAARPDAILTAQPNLAELLARTGCRVPQDVAVAATSLLDGRFEAGVDQNSVEVGRVALATLTGLIQQNERGVPAFCRRTLVEGRWVDGSSLPAKT
jgi:DNA-binding LacI/PurR family transcriptional regulator